MILLSEDGFLKRESGLTARCPYCKKDLEPKDVPIKIAGDAREKLEKETGRRVSTRKNYLPGCKSKKALG